MTRIGRAFSRLSATGSAPHWMPSRFESITTVRRRFPVSPRSRSSTSRSRCSGFTQYRPTLHGLRSWDISMSPIPTMRSVRFFIGQPHGHIPTMCMSCRRVERKSDELWRFATTYVITVTPLAPMRISSVGSRPSTSPPSSRLVRRMRTRRPRSSLRLLRAHSLRATRGSSEARRSTRCTRRPRGCFAAWRQRAGREVDDAAGLVTVCADVALEIGAVAAREHAGPRSLSVVQDGGEPAASVGTRQRRHLPYNGRHLAGPESKRRKR